MKNFQKGSAGIVVAVIIALIVIGGGVYYFKTKKAVAPMVTETADWKSYRNDEYGFEFEYPPQYGDLINKPEEGFLFQLVPGSTSSKKINPIVNVKVVKGVLDFALNNKVCTSGRYLYIDYMAHNNWEGCHARYADGGGGFDKVLIPLPDKDLTIEVGFWLVAGGMYYQGDGNYEDDYQELEGFNREDLFASFKLIKNN